MKLRNKHVSIMIATIILMLSVNIRPASAEYCASISRYLDDVRSNLMRAATEYDPAAAMHYARLTEGDLGYASRAARNCGCAKAFQEFDIAASFARRAYSASDNSEFANMMLESARSFNAGLSALDQCSRRQ